MNVKKMLVNMGASVISFIVALLISFVLSPYVVSQLGEEAYGFQNLANNFVSYATLVTTAVNAMASRFISVEYNQGRIEKAKKFFSSVFIINCIVYSVILVVSLIFIYRLEAMISVSPHLVNQVKLTFLFSFLNLGVSMMGTVYTAAVFATNNMHWSSALQIVINVVRSVMVFGLFLCLNPKVYYLSLAALVAGVINFVGNYIFTKKLFDGFGIRLKLFDTSAICTLVKSGSWILLSNISNMLLNGFDLLLCNQFISSAVMGRLSIAKQIPTAISQILGTLSSIFTAALTEAFAKGTKKKIVEDTNLLLRILALFLSVPFAGIIVYGRSFLELWLSSVQYEAKQIEQIYWIMFIVLVDIVISTYMYSIHSVFIALDKVKFYAMTLFVSSIVSVVITLILLISTRLGVFAIVGTSTVVLGITHGIIVPAYAAKLLEERIYVFWNTELKSWTLMGSLCVIFGIISKCFEITSWIEFFGVIAVNGIIGYIFSFLFVLRREEQKMLIKKFILRGRNLK